jgi:signal transduction histidine kinase
LPHIFEPFYTTKADGMGLGLWISHSLVEQHGGILVAENLDDNQGACFTVKIPFASVAQMQPEMELPDGNRIDNPTN